MNEMKDVVMGIAAFNPLGEQKRLPIPTDLTKRSSNADEIVEIDQYSQGVNRTQDKSVPSLSGSDVKSTRSSLRSFPGKTAQPILKSQLSNTYSTLPISKTLQNISKEDLLANKEIICGKKVKVPFPGIGNFICKIEKYNRASDTSHQS